VFFPQEVSVAQRVLVAWSGGKDSAMALHELRKAPDIEVVGLLTTVTEGYDRISMHGVRRVLLERQAESSGLALSIVHIPPDCSNQVYESRMREELERFQGDGVGAVAFGDLFLEEIRLYRETNVAKIGMRSIFPLWGKDTRELAREFLAFGFKGVVVCVDTQQIPASFAGRLIDDDFLSDLPPGADPCGENGEFHTFVFDGPIFKKPIASERGQIVARGQFTYCDLVPTLQKPLVVRG
jgi:uncharacterized protein (TIGR00290 family)